MGVLDTIVPLSVTPELAPCTLIVPPQDPEP
jgi:hypothetical protein